MSERDERIQSALDNGESAILENDADVVAYQHLYRGLSSRSARLPHDFSSAVMIEVIARKLRRAKWESGFVSLALAGLIVLAVSVMFSVLSFLGLFETTFDYSRAASILPASIDYTWPCVLAVVILVAMDEAFSFWRGSLR